MAATEAKAKRQRVVHSAREKAEAVLAWWAERWRPSEICREMKITSNLLSQWQERAMVGILAALEPRTRTDPDRKPEAPKRLTALVQAKEAETPKS